MRKFFVTVGCINLVLGTVMLIGRGYEPAEIQFLFGWVFALMARIEVLESRKTTINIKYPRGWALTLTDEKGNPL